MTSRIAGDRGGRTIGQAGPSRKPPPGSSLTRHAGRESEITCIEGACEPHCLHRRSLAMSRANARSPQRRNAVSSRMRAQLLHRLQLMKRPSVVHWPSRPLRFSALYEPILATCSHFVLARQPPLWQRSVQKPLFASLARAAFEQEVTASRWAGIGTGSGEATQSSALCSYAPVFNKRERGPNDSRARPAIRDRGDRILLRRALGWSDLLSRRPLSNLDWRMGRGVDARLLGRILRHRLARHQLLQWAALNKASAYAVQPHACAYPLHKAARSSRRRLDSSSALSASSSSAHHWSNSRR